CRASDPQEAYGGHVGCCVDVTERRAQAERLFAALREKEVLLAEVHHRVKNNLAIIASLVSLQSEATEDLSVREVLAESEGRVRSHGPHPPGALRALAGDEAVPHGQGSCSRRVRCRRYRGCRTPQLR
ncbi:MAG: sensor histidine kinase, partial [Beggiatoa sp.]|nr:sensor histidine kinase [Beggiatoa sp.]